MSVTIDSILNKLTEWVENKTPISPELWIDAGLKMNLLKDSLTKEMIELQQILALKKVELIQNDKSVSYANTIVQSTDEYAKYKLLESKIKMIEEHIRLAKQKARMAQDDYNSQWK